MHNHKLNSYIGVMILFGWYAGGCAKTIEMRTFPTTKIAVNQLQSGAVDAVVGDFPVIAYEAREAPGKLQIGGLQFQKATIGIGVSKDSKALEAVLTDALRQIMEDKTYTNVLISWGLIGAEVESPKTPANLPFAEEVPELKDGKLKVGLELNYPPMEFFDELKKEAGVDVELAKALAKALRVEVEFVDMPFDALIGAVETRKVDVIISSMAITDERAQRIDFVPYLSLGSGILVPKGNPNTIRTVKDLCGYSVGVQEATSQIAILQAEKCK